MRAALLGSVTLALLGGGGALAWDLAVVTDEERVMEVVATVVDARDTGRAEAFRRTVSLESHPLEISAPGLEHVYDAADESPLLDLVAQIQEGLSGADVSLVQSEVRVQGDRARVTLNVEIDRGEEVGFWPMDVDLRRLGDGFVVTRVRLHR